jgi:uncharacterized membrane protein YtjA (UPF0391 family)
MGCNHPEDQAMLKWAFVFLVIAIIAGIFGFTDVEAASATIAQWLFGIFLVLFLGALVIGLAIGAKLTS